MCTKWVCLVRALGKRHGFPRAYQKDFIAKSYGFRNAFPAFGEMFHCLVLLIVIAEMDTFTLWLSEFRGSETNILCLMSDQSRCHYYRERTETLVIYQSLLASQLSRDYFNISESLRLESDRTHPAKVPFI